MSEGVSEGVSEGLREGWTKRKENEKIFTSEHV